MYEQLILKYLHTNKIVSDELFEKINTYLKSKLFSIHYELRLLVYLGVLMLSTGLGILIYKNYEVIGHNAIVAAIGLISFGCLGYCYYKRNPFSKQQVTSPGIVYDYVALLGCLTFATLSGYLQYQFRIFGEHYGLMALIPCCLFFICAYIFDSKGILSLAIAALYAWAGLSIAPREVIAGFGSTTTHYIYTGFALGLLMAAFAFATKKYDFKNHFEFTYLNFAFHTLFISSLSGLFNEGLKIIYFLLLAALVFLVFRKANQEKSFYFFLCAVVYGYVGITYAAIQLMDEFHFFDSIIYFAYFIFSGIGMIKLLKNFHKKFKANDVV